MKNQRWYTISVVLALAVVMLWAVPTLAQGRGQGQGGQGGQGWGCGQGQGQGAGNGTCPAVPGYQSGQGNSRQQPPGQHRPPGSPGRRPHESAQHSAHYAPDPITSNVTR